jgi:hypothetical protein
MFKRSLVAAVVCGEERRQVGREVIRRTERRDGD